MKPESEDVLSALIDGEAVEPDRLAEVLSQAGAAEMLVAFARIRQRVEDDGAEPGRRFYARMSDVFHPAQAERLMGPRWLLPRLAVVLLVVSAAVGGAWFGRQSRPPAGDALLTGAYCTDNLGTPHTVGAVTAVDGRRVECVLRGEWVPVAR